MYWLKGLLKMVRVAALIVMLVTPQVTWGDEENRGGSQDSLPMTVRPESSSPVAKWKAAALDPKRNGMYARLDAVIELAKIRTAESELAIHEVLKGATGPIEQDGPIKRQAILALSGYDSNQTADILVNLLATERWREPACEALVIDDRQKTKMTALSRLMERGDLPDDAFICILQHLESCQVTGVVSSVRCLAVRANSQNVRVKAYEYLGAVQDVGSFQYLSDRTVNKELDEAERRSALRAAAQCCETGSVLKLLDVWENDDALRVSAKAARNEVLAYRFDRKTVKVSGLRFNQERNRLSWNAIDGVTQYVVQLSGQNTACFLVDGTSITVSVPKGTYRVDVYPCYVDDYVLAVREALDGAAARLGDAVSETIVISESNHQTPDILEAAPTVSTDEVGLHPDRFDGKVVTMLVGGPTEAMIYPGFEVESGWMYHIISSGEMGSLPINCSLWVWRDRRRAKPNEAQAHEIVIGQVKKRIKGGYAFIGLATCRVGKL